MSSSFPQGFTLRGFYIDSAELALEARVLDLHCTDICFQFCKLLGKAGHKCVSIGKARSSGSNVTIVSPLVPAHTVRLWPQCDIEETVG